MNECEMYRPTVTGRLLLLLRSAARSTACSSTSRSAARRSSTCWRSAARAAARSASAARSAARSAANSRAAARWRSAARSTARSSAWRSAARRSSACSSTCWRSARAAARGAVLTWPGLSEDADCLTKAHAYTAKHGMRDILIAALTDITTRKDSDVLYMSLFDCDNFRHTSWRTNRPMPLLLCRRFDAWLRLRFLRTVVRASLTCRQGRRLPCRHCGCRGRRPHRRRLHRLHRRPSHCS